METASPKVINPLLSPMFTQLFPRNHRHVLGNPKGFNGIAPVIQMDAHNMSINTPINNKASIYQITADVAH